MWCKPSGPILQGSSMGIYEFAAGRRVHEQVDLDVVVTTVQRIWGPGNDEG